MGWPGLTQLARGLGQLMVPNACLVCDAPEGDRTDFRHGLCNECRGSITCDPHPSCPRCAATVGPHAENPDGCIGCRGTSLGFDIAFRLGPYEGRLRDAILRMKLAGGDGLSEMMGRVFRDVVPARLEGEGIQLVVPVPLHWRRQWNRGHNQAAGVARELAAGLGVPFAPGGLRRVRYTPQQLQPTRTARRENVRGAFRAKRGASLGGRAVLLVDDVMTTGSTASEAAKALREAGAGRVVAAVLARR